MEELRVVFEIRSIGGQALGTTTGEQSPALTNITLNGSVAECCFSVLSEASFQLFLGGGQFLFLFFNATRLLKNWKKTALYM